MMDDIFLSYSRQNKTLMTRLHSALDKEGISIWVDWEDIPKGEDWLQAIYDGIEGAHKFVCIISPDWLVSEICHQEMTYARTHNKPIIPIIYEETKIVDVAGHWYEREWEQDARANWTTLNHLNWQFFREEDDFDTALTELVEVLQSDFDHVRIHTRLLTQARDWEKAEHATTRLLRGDDLLHAEEWLITSKDKQPQPTDLIRAYIHASREQAELLVAEESRRQKQLQRLRIGAIIPALIGIVTTIIAIWAGLDARAAFNDRALAQATMTQANAELQNVQHNVEIAQTEIAQSKISLTETSLEAAAMTAYNEARSLTHVGQYDRALAAYEFVLTWDAEYGAAYLGMAEIHLELDQEEEARSNFEQAYEIFRADNDQPAVATVLFQLSVLVPPEEGIEMVREALYIWEKMEAPMLADAEARLAELQAILDDSNNTDD